MLCRARSGSMDGGVDACWRADAPLTCSGAKFGGFRLDVDANFDHDCHRMIPGTHRLTGLLVAGFALGRFAASIALGVAPAAHAVADISGPLRTSAPEMEQRIDRAFAIAGGNRSELAAALERAPANSVMPPPSSSHRPGTAPSGRTGRGRSSTPPSSRRICCSPMSASGIRRGRPFHGRWTSTRTRFDDLYSPTG